MTHNFTDDKLLAIFEAAFITFDEGDKTGTIYEYITDKLGLEDDFLYRLRDKLGDYLEG